MSLLWPATAESISAPARLVCQVPEDWITTTVGCGGHSASRCRTSSSTRQSAASARPQSNLPRGLPCPKHSLRASRRRSGHSSGLGRVGLRAMRRGRRCCRQNAGITAGPSRTTATVTTVCRCEKVSVLCNPKNRRSRSPATTRRVQTRAKRRFPCAMVVATSRRRRTAACDFKKSASTSCCCVNDVPLLIDSQILVREIPPPRPLMSLIPAARKRSPSGLRRDSGRQIPQWLWICQGVMCRHFLHFSRTPHL